MRKALKLALLLLIAGVVILLTAQNAGNTGTATIAQQAVYTANVSQIFRNVGQSAHYLTFCNSSFAGSIDLEESFDGSTNWVPIALAFYASTGGSLDSSCHVLQAGGYYQNVRSVIVPISGSVSGAWYTATSGPIGFAPSGASTQGATAPPVCDTSKHLVVVNGSIAGFFTANTGQRVHVCAYSLSFVGATAAGFVQFGDGPGGCASQTPRWSITTFTSTPQVVALGSGTGMLFQTGILGASQGTLCVQNTSGSDVDVSVDVAIY